MSAVYVIIAYGMKITVKKLSSLIYNLGQRLSNQYLKLVQRTIYRDLFKGIFSLNLLVYIVL